MFKQYLKGLIVSMVLFMLAGCGEKFDASSESMIKISYNAILADLDGEDRDNFIRQYDMYTDMYLDPFGGEAGDGSYEQNDIESLHGMSYGKVVDVVAEHEEHVMKLIEVAEVAQLTNLHVAAITSSNNINYLLDSFQLAFGKMGSKGFSYGGLDAFGYGSVVVKITNNSDSAIKVVDVCVSVIRTSDNEEVGYYCYTASTDGISPGKTGGTIIKDVDLWNIVGKDGFDISMYIGAVYDGAGNNVYPYMSDDDHNTYNALKATYVREFEKIVAHHGPVPE